MSLLAPVALLHHLRDPLLRLQSGLAVTLYCQRKQAIDVAAVRTLLMSWLHTSVPLSSSVHAPSHTLVSAPGSGAVSPSRVDATAVMTPLSSLSPGGGGTSRGYPQYVIHVGDRTRARSEAVRSNAEGPGPAPATHPVNTSASTLGSGLGRDNADELRLGKGLGSFTSALEHPSAAAAAVADNHDDHRHEEELQERRQVLSQLEAQAAQVAADHQRWLKRHQEKMEEEQRLHQMRTRAEKEHLARLSQLEDQVTHPLDTPP